MTADNALDVLHDAELSQAGLHYLIGILSVDAPDVLANAVEFVKKVNNPTHFENPEPKTPVIA